MNADSATSYLSAGVETTDLETSDRTQSSDVGYGGPIARKRRFEDACVKNGEQQADKSCQTQPVLIFSSNFDLQQFLRLNRCLAEQRDRSIQTDRAPPSPTDCGFGPADRLLLLNLHQAVLTLSANSQPSPPPPPPPLPSKSQPPPPPQLRSPSPLLTLKQEAPDWCKTTQPPAVPLHSSPGPSAAEFSLLSAAVAENGDCSSESSLRIRARLHKLNCVPRHRIVEITSHHDVRPTAGDEEFRISHVLCEALLKKSCSVGNFGWRLVCAIYKTDELRDRNYYGNRGKRALSPRRLHAVEHAYYDYLPGEEPTHCLIEARNAINQGLRNLAHNCIVEFSDQSAMWSEQTLKIQTCPERYLEN